VRGCFEQLRRAASAAALPLPDALPANDDAFWPSSLGLDGEVIAR
jgi:hypothetical protein